MLSFSKEKSNVIPNELQLWTFKLKFLDKLTITEEGELENAARRSNMIEDNVEQERNILYL